MYICIYVYMYTCIYVCVYKCAYVCIGIIRETIVYIGLYIYINTNITYARVVPEIAACTVM